MKILEKSGDDNLATVYVAQLGDDDSRIVEFVESTQPPVPRDQKWVLIVSTMLGCPVECMMCDAGGDFKGKLSEAEILEQIDFLIKSRFNGGTISIPKLKIQFARMGEPAFNPNVISVMNDLPGIYDAPGLMPCISTIAPSGAARFFDELLEVKNRYYSNGKFQLQFSIHSSDPETRDRLIPSKKWGFEQIADYGKQWFSNGDRKITLNFAPISGLEVDPNVIREYFDPARFYIKLTPVNPTHRMKENNLKSLIETETTPEGLELKRKFEDAGFDAQLSIGELAENQIGSNCGFYVSRLKRASHQ
jgi:23S rRNA (adenine2503-C2)-methyltransferase